MKKHNGMKTHDVLILLYISLYADGAFKYTDVSRDLEISQSEVSESINRSKIAKLISQDKFVARNSLVEFLESGFRYVFPVVPGAIVRGFATSHSANPLNKLIVSSNEEYVWKHPKGDIRGMEIQPLYKTVPNIVSKFPKLHECLSLIDAIRIGRAREVNLAKKLLKKELINEG